MAKDPFQDLPTIEPEGEPEQVQGFAEPAKETATEVAASSPPRNLIKTATNLAVPIVAGVTAIWFFFTPDNPRAGKRVEAQKVDVDVGQQSAVSNALFKQLKTDADKPRPVVAPVMPGMPGSLPPSGQPGTTTTAQAGTAPPLPHGSASPQTPVLAVPQRGGYSPAGGASPYPTYGAQGTTGYAAQGNPATPSPMPTAMSEEAAKAAQDRIAAQLKREEEIRSAPLEAGQVRLLSQGSSSDGAKVPTALGDLQADLAGERERQTALHSQQAMQEQLLAAMALKEPAKSRGANEDFLTNAAATSAARSPVSSLQSAAGRYLVGEGTIIRAVLQTNVNSDLPGRVLARITSDVYDSTQRHVVIPKGSIINGVYNSQVIVGQERLLMAMTRLTLPNGNWISLNGSGATDMMGTSGVAAEVNNHFLKMFGSSLIVGASTLMLPRADTSVTTLPGTTGSSGAATAGSVFATTLNEVLKTLLDRNKNIAPTLKLHAGDEFIFMANQDMLMAPYR